jgi:hypothetical protein
MTAAVTAQDVAKWMVEDMAIQQGFLYQGTAVFDIERLFGPQFVYFNKQGNLAIHNDVLKAFNKLTPDCVWERGNRLWRKRQEGDLPGRMQP